MRKLLLVLFALAPVVAEAQFVGYYTYPRGWDTTGGSAFEIVDASTRSLRIAVVATSADLNFEPSGVRMASLAPPLSLGGRAMLNLGFPLFQTAYPGIFGYLRGYDTVTGAAFELTEPSTRTVRVNCISGCAAGIGGAVTGATATRVLFTDSSANLADDADFTFVTDTLSVTKLQVGGSTNTYPFVVRAVSGANVGIINNGGTAQIVSANDAGSTTAPLQMRASQFNIMGGASGAVTEIGAGRDDTTTSVITLNNGASAKPLIVAQDNGTPTYTMQDGGSTWAMMANKSLTDNTIATFARIAVTSGSLQGGIIRYCGIGSSVTPHVQARCGIASFSVINNAGTEVCTIGTPADVVSVSTGTLTVAFATDTAATNACDLRVTVDSSLNSTVSFSYQIELSGSAATAVTAQ